ncbi:unnamed protein product [Rotaria magnacalcarata]|uniref:Cytochrome P450 n=5 Tax=Rotaria magnacalcarata TaxID=392030 RepID=A0A819TCV9_9BILA|nr:unnamed protein product [Rotaria magnacalcarata]CAF3962816.1 unnamed protein product [Rotaria magnacalcarata]CAF4079596.1 unnamed protein product [Rotaria magnacalcarata]
MLLLTGFLLITLLIIIIAYLRHIREKYSLFNRLNIPGPPPTLFFGNFFDLVKTKRLSISIKQWTEKYGRIFGYFEGHTPILVVSNPDVLQDVFVKSFSNFHSRRTFPLENRFSKTVNMFGAFGLRWKRQRTVINPTFSSAKMKNMMPLFYRSIDTFMSKMVEEHKMKQPFDIYAYFKRFTMDTIWSCCFGIETDMQNNVHNPYLFHAQKVFSEENSVKILILLSLFITELNDIWYGLHLVENYIRQWIRQMFSFTQKYIDEEPSKWIVRQAYELIDKRENFGQNNRTDLMQLMLESASKDDAIEDSKSFCNKTDETIMEQPIVRKLTIPEIASNVLLFMVAGYETTSTALAYAAYVLATHPKEQRQLQEHIDNYFDSETGNIRPSYDTVSKMDYLDMFIREILRMYPIAPIVINRQSTEDFRIEHIGIIPAGTSITVDIYSLHFDPALWGPVDPHRFYPERFATKRHPMAWIPFGIGPRNCVGMRFALTELKMLLICLLKKYSVIDCGDQTHKPFENLKEYIVIAPDQVIVRLQPRNEQH